MFTNVPSKRNKQKTFEKKLVGISSATDENSRIRIRKSAVRIRTNMSWMHPQHCTEDTKEGNKSSQCREKDKGAST
jgi:hypothetical protein